MNRIRRGDDVIVLAGKDKGKRGSVLQVLPNDKEVGESVNIAKRHTRPNPNKGIAGGIVEKAMPIHISNVGLFNPTANKADRVGIKVLDDGKRVRYYKSNGEVVDV